MKHKALTPLALPLGQVLQELKQEYVDRRFASLTDVINAVVALCPQASDTPPKDPPDGALRLSRGDWRPVEGQAEDRWVYYDAARKSWQFFS